METNLDSGALVIQNPEPWKKALCELLKSCYPLFEDANDDMTSSKVAAISAGVSTFASEPVPILASAVFSSSLSVDMKIAYFTSNSITEGIEWEKRFTTGHATMKRLDYVNGYEAGLSEGKGFGKSAGERYGFRSSGFTLPAQRRAYDEIATKLQSDLE